MICLLNRARDLLLEMHIKKTAKQMLLAQDRACKESLANKLADLIKGRSAYQVNRMEKRQGLDHA